MNPAPEIEKSHYRRVNPRIPGIVQAAKELGVSRNFLWKVINGRGKSKRVRAGWEAWRQQHPELLLPSASSEPLPGQYSNYIRLPRREPTPPPVIDMTKVRAAVAARAHGRWNNP